MLGAARYVVSRKIRRAELRGSAGRVLDQLRSFLSHAKALEPTSEELNLAITLELSAQRAGLGLHEGESQLCSILVIRSIARLLTGDKRAITAIESLVDMVPGIMPICGRVQCLEQLVLNMVADGDPTILRSNICAEPLVDTALSVCFSCASPSVSSICITEGLVSYIKDLRREAVRVLAP